MTNEQMRQALRAAPFRPFTIRTADGREFPVSHPEAVMFSASGRTIALALPDDSIAIVDLLLVVSLGVTPARPQRRRAG